MPLESNQQICLLRQKYPVLKIEQQFIQANNNKKQHSNEQQLLTTTINTNNYKQQQ